MISAMGIIFLAVLMLNAAVTYTMGRQLKGRGLGKAAGFGLAALIVYLLLAYPFSFWNIYFCFDEYYASFSVLAVTGLPAFMCGLKCKDKKSEITDVPEI
jgi:hypothetical protein